MKKFLLKIALCATMLLALGGVITPLVVSAEESVETPEIITEIADTDIVSSEDETAENSPEIVEETETSKWFDETLKPLLLEYGAEVAAIATVVFVCLRDLKPRAEGAGEPSPTASCGRYREGARAVLQHNEYKLGYAMRSMN